MSQASSDTRLFADAVAGSLDANRILPAIYDELRALAASQLARERSGHTLQPTALAHEAYLKLIDQTRVKWQGRAHFMAVAAEMIRRILVDYARAKGAQKRGGGMERVTLTGLADSAIVHEVDLMDVDAALETLRQLNDRQAKVVELKFFGGLENKEIAEVLGVSETLIKDEWRFARAWLATRLEGPERN